MRLGKQDYEHDPRTVALGSLLKTPAGIPPHYNFDMARTPIPIKVWGNDKWGDCVMAGRANHLLRLERLEQRRTVRLNDGQVVEEYQYESAVQFGKSPKTAGDPNDQGLIVLQALKYWRNTGWMVNKKNYKIAAYGELDPADTYQLRQAIYLLHGIQFGFALPAAVHGNTSLWDVGGTEPEWRPGSWGGHLVYAKAYDEKTFEILSWGEKIRVTDAFVRRYCDEVWAVVDSLDPWKKRPEFDVTALEKILHDIGAKVSS